eukprot:scaffold2506_cov71-Phaeocystis_antarctica.AAC.2
MTFGWEGTPRRTRSSPFALHHASHSFRVVRPFSVANALHSTKSTPRDTWTGGHPSPHALLAIRLAPRLPLGSRRDALLRHERPSLAVAHKRRILIGNASRLGALRLRRLSAEVGGPLLHLRLGVGAEEAGPALPPAVLVGGLWLGGHPSPQALLATLLAPRTPLGFRRDALLRRKRLALRQARPPPSRVRKRPAWLQVEAATKRLKHLDDRKLHHLERRARPSEPVCKAKERRRPTCQLPRLRHQPVGHVAVQIDACLHGVAGRHPNVRKGADAACSYEGWQVLLQGQPRSAARLERACTCGEGVGESDAFAWRHAEDVDVDAMWRVERSSRTIRDRAQ